MQDLESRSTTGLLTYEQLNAIKLQIIVGRQLQIDLPEIANDYREGRFLREIASRYEIPSRYGLTMAIAKGAISKAIRGHNGGFNIPPYNGLINSDELEKLCEEHVAKGISIGGYRAGNKLYEQRLGIHGRSIEQHRRDGRKGGSELYKKRKGIHGRTLQERSEYNRRAGIQATIARGFTPYSASEIEYTFDLLQNPKYNIGDQSNNVLIARELNARFHNNRPVRNNRTIRYIISKLRKEHSEK